MATTGKTIFNSETGYQRDEARVGTSQAHIIRARVLLAYIEKYHPKEHALFFAGLGGIPQSFDNEQYVHALLQFAEAFLQNHPEDQERLQSISPREMVEEVSQQLVEDAEKRRADIRRRASEIVQKYARGTTTEKQDLEDKLVTSINASINKAETPQQLRAAIEEEVATMPLPTKEVVQQLVDADPLSSQHLLLTNPARDSVVVGHITALPAPAWRGYVAAVENLQMGPTETIDELTKRAKGVGLTTAFLSADLSQVPAARIEPSGLISAILEATGSKTVVTNAVALTIVAKAWEDAIEIVTKRAGGTVTGALEEIIKQGNAQWGARSGEPLGKAGSAVASVLGEILTPTFINYVDAQSLLPTLGGQDGNRVAAFIKSLPAAQPDEGAATTALLLAITTTWRPGDVRFEWQEAQDGGGLGAWAVHVAKDSVLEKLFSKFAKSKVVEAAGGVVKKGGASLVAGILTKLGLSAAVDVVITMIGTPIATAIKWAIQAAIWLGGYIWRPISNFLGKLARDEIAHLDAAQNAIKQTLDSWLGPRPPAAPKQWYEQEWVLIALVVTTAVFLPMFGAMMLITSRDSALFVAGYNNRPEGFTKFNQTFSQPPTYIDPSLFVGREFNCLSFGQGLDTGEGVSRGLTSSEVDRITRVVSKYPQINLLSCGLSCPSRKINITAFSEPSDYGGFAPSLRPGNVILYQHTFTGYDDQTFAYLLLHELAHQHDWFNTPIETGFGSLGCGSTPPSTYGYSGNSAEAFAESVALYLINNPEITTYCGGRAYNYLNGAFNQCR